MRLTALYCLTCNRAMSIPQAAWQQRKEKAEGSVSSFSLQPLSPSPKKRRRGRREAVAWKHEEKKKEEGKSLVWLACLLKASSCWACEKEGEEGGWGGLEKRKISWCGRPPLTQCVLVRRRQWLGMTSLPLTFSFAGRKEGRKGKENGNREEAFCNTVICYRKALW